MTDKDIIYNKTLDKLNDIKEELSEILIDNIIGELDEITGMICINPNTDNVEIKRFGNEKQKNNFYALIKIKEKDMCKPNDIKVFWHTHGIGSSTLSQTDILSANDFYAEIGEISLCAIGINGMSCSFPYLNPPKVETVFNWDDIDIMDKIKEQSENVPNKSVTIIADAIACQNEECTIINRDFGIKEPYINDVKYVSTLNKINIFSKSYDGFIIEPQFGKMKCIRLLSDDETKSLICKGGDI